MTGMMGDKIRRQANHTERRHFTSVFLNYFPCTREINRSTFDCILLADEGDAAGHEESILPLTGLLWLMNRLTRM